MKFNHFFLLLIGTLLLATTGCTKNEDENDLTTEAVGHYTNTAKETDMIVTKVDNQTIAISFTTGSGSGKYSIAFPKATMTSKNAFTLEEVVDNDPPCQGTYTYTGTGSCSNNNISLFINVDATGLGTPYDCTDGTRNVSGSK